MIRRRWLALCKDAAATALAVLVSTQLAEAKPATRRFSGSSKRGSIDEALGRAIASAERAAGHPDALINWKLETISGRSGGIGFHDVKVVIQASVT